MRLTRKMRCSLPSPPEPFSDDLSPAHADDSAGSADLPDGWVPIGSNVETGITGCMCWTTARRRRR
ncbi:hypothetical protein [Solicola gregarius]|uniref:Uncharacterized protein n=1 Tax=Solicola gregarius TaxID=2908642 RepID=A0AA46TI00_9ACTN|nr:hypothetical protein [Solicola gregarius]UYM05508.1 hypothetical protein L0C25_23875 [Solicola gregarius]